MKLKKRIAAIGAAVMMATSMMSISASAANTSLSNNKALSFASAKSNNYLIVSFSPKTAMIMGGPKDPRNLMTESEERSYQLNYKYAALRPSTAVLVKKNSGDGRITVTANYLENKKSVSKDSTATLKIKNSSKDQYYIIDNHSFSDKFSVKNNDHVTVRFQIKSDSNKIVKNTRIDSVNCDVKYSN